VSWVDSLIRMQSHGLSGAMAFVASRLVLGGDWRGTRGSFQVLCRRSKVLMLCIMGCQADKRGSGL